MSRVGARCMSKGREFQRVGATTLKACPQRFVCWWWRADPCLRTAISAMGHGGGEGQIGTTRAWRDL